jgi:hypothetical protein
MSKRRTGLVFTVCLILAGAALLMPGCAAKKAAPGGAAVTLEYRLPKGAPVTYRNAQASTQTMEMMGQKFDVKTDKELVFTLTPGEFRDNRQQLKVAVDSLAAVVESPQGELTADVAPVLGQTFEMYLSNVGKEEDLAGADEIKYSIGAAGERSMEPDFRSMFPDLPDMPVKVGDTWTVRDTANVDEGGMALTITTETVDTLEGFENLDGIDCARITGMVTGSITGSGEQQGTQVTIDSKMQGTETWLFAYKAGRLARFNSDTSMDGAVTLGGPQGMNMPMTQEVKTETILVK